VAAGEQQHKISGLDRPVKEKALRH